MTSIPTDLCPFCLENQALQDAPLFRGTAFYVLGMLAEERQHAVMIIPYAHVETPFDIAAADWASLPEALAFAKEYLAPWGPAGFTMGWNVGRVAGQTVDHVHLHVVARFEGDHLDSHGLNALFRHFPKDL